MRPEERPAQGLIPSPDLRRLIHEYRGRSGVFRRIDAAHLLPSQRVSVRWLRFWLLAAAIAALGLASTMIVARRVARPLSFGIEGASIASDGRIESAADLEARVHFSDGTEVSFAPGTKAILRRVDDHGARVALIAGTAHVDVIHRAEARWLFDAGPFLIVVTGTAFTLGWTGNEQRLDVQMERGSIEVQGPLSDGPLVIRAEQHLTVRIREGETVIRDAGHGAAAARIPPVEATATTERAAYLDAPLRPGEPARDHARTTEADSSLQCRSPSSDWNVLLARGSFGAILQETDRYGVERCVATLGSGDLAALADAARYARRDDLARRVLVAERRRFGSSSAARDAAFLLGRLEETNERVPTAIEWFNAYLAESPSGTYASEALGRKMVLLRRASGDAAARPFAVEYLQRYPGGAYAVTARALGQTP